MEDDSNICQRALAIKVPRATSILGRVCEALKAGPENSANICFLVGLSYRRVMQAVRNGVALGVIVKTEYFDPPRFTYSLANPDQEVREVEEISDAEVEKPFIHRLTKASECPRIEVQQHPLITIFMQPLPDGGAYLEAE